MLFSFIPQKLAIAPSIPKAEFPNLLLREIIIDRNSLFQVWSPKSNAILNTLEADLLKSDCLRVEAICTRLVSLVGATCSEHEEHLLSNQKLIDNWEDVKYFASKYKFKPNAIDVLYSTQTIRQLNVSSNNSLKWVLEPPCWEIFFLEVNPVDQGFKAVSRPNNYLSVILWTGKPIIKHIPQMRSRK
ncbi:hypothetical protein I4641_02180 [Waterburya agarophytonicola K14]|uniref:Uncharacterized protein n=1 Tax=Waterburya agarophytonicola KI4 TaxID=2874699 RepID=A0A964BLV7_9CYAN|nr:hypothetical protein [Waterburya agarophytonicola]MCC0175788.1 hypothetical protein [Waterburya agarophytonicola KI4]